MKYITTIHDKAYTIEINDDHSVIVDGVVHPVDFASINQQPVFTLLIDGQSHEAYIQEDEDGRWQVLLRGSLYSVEVEDEREKRLRAAGGAHNGAARGEFNLKAPMPGLVVVVPVTEGQTVKKGDNLIILESMKMQNELKSPRDGAVTRVKVKPGDSVEQNQVMVTIT
ncbi:MAG: acetyl-CoA carboxylase biotin carboxyl carrier protein subunit [Anaerolineales bacterium]